MLPAVSSWLVTHGRANRTDKNSGYTCGSSSGGPQACLTRETTGSFQDMTCSSGNMWINWITMPIKETVTSDEVSMLEHVTIYAPMFQINHKSTDLPSLTGLSTQTTIPTTTIPSESGGLSKEAQGGIGGGVGAVGLAVFAAAIYFWRRRRSSANVELAELQSCSVPKHAPVELDGNPRAEMG